MHIACILLQDMAFQSQTVGTIPTFYNKIQWREWHCATSFNYQVLTTPHPVLNFLRIYMSPVQLYPSLFWSITDHSSGISAYYGIDF